MPAMRQRPPHVPGGAAARRASAATNAAATVALMATTAAAVAGTSAAAPDPEVADAAAPRVAVHDRAVPTSTLLSFERTRLAGGERMGLMGATLLFGLAGDWWLGPAVYGAATGERGGWFVGGAELQRRWRLGDGTLAAGLYVGAGGGNSVPMGGGLLLRPALSAWHPLGPLQVGLAWSALRAPAGTLASQQLALLLAWDGRFRHAEAARAGLGGQSREASGLGIDRLVGTATRYGLRTPVHAGWQVDLVGARMERSWPSSLAGSRWRWGLETAGAAGGSAGGYMEILASAGWDAPLGLPGLRGGARMALGLGGGGGVPTGGGAIGKLSLGVGLDLGPRVATGIELGRVQAADVATRGHTTQWWLALALEPGPGADGLRRGRLARTEWTATAQHYRHAARRAGPARALDTIGLKIARPLGDRLYGTVQAHSAWAGDAGAYGVGLVGAGLVSGWQAEPWRAGAELLVGAAGGGNVASGGGAIVQGLGWLAFGIGDDLELRVGAGALRARREGLSTPILELAISRAFAQLAP